MKSGSLALLASDTIELIKKQYEIKCVESTANVLGRYCSYIDLFE